LIENSEKKPLRIFTHVSENDNRAKDPEETYHNWVMANERTAAALKAKLKREPNLDVRTVTVTTNPAGEDTGTQVFTALNSALADVAPSRVAGAFLITDGEVHDIPAKAC